jgi:hypothetical protein
MTYTSFKAWVSEHPTVLNSFVGSLREQAWSKLPVLKAPFASQSKSFCFCGSTPKSQKGSSKITSLFGKAPSSIAKSGVLYQRDRNEFEAGFFILDKGFLY